MTVNFSVANAARKFFSKLTACRAFTWLKSSRILKLTRSLPLLPRDQKSLSRFPWWGIALSASLILFYMDGVRWYRQLIVALHVFLLAKYVWHISAMKALRDVEAGLLKEKSSLMKLDLYHPPSPRSQEAQVTAVYVAQYCAANGGVPSNSLLN